MFAGLSLPSQQQGTSPFSVLRRELGLKELDAVQKQLWGAGFPSQLAE